LCLRCLPLALRRPSIPRIDLRELVAIFAGGCIGAVTRVWVARAVPVSPHGWPWPTFLVNVVGALLLGYFATRLQERLPLSAYRRPFLGTGICGGLTTFSTMQVEVLKMIDARDFALAIGYVAASMLAGLTAVAAATAAVRRVKTL
jgi:CrcB protein